MPRETDYLNDEAYVVNTVIGDSPLLGLITRYQSQYKGTFLTLSSRSVRNPYFDVHPNLVRQINISGGDTSPVNGNVELGDPADGASLKYYAAVTGPEILTYETPGVPMSVEEWLKHRVAVGSYIEALASYIQQFFNQSPDTHPLPTDGNLSLMASAINRMPPRGIPTARTRE